VFYKSWHEAIKQFPAEVQGEIYTAIFEYGLYGNETHNMGKVASAIWALIKPQINANQAKYENSLKGGAPRGNKNNPNGRRGKFENQPNNQPRTNLEPTENQPNEHEHDHENEYENGNVNVACENSLPPIFDSDSENSDCASDADSSQYQATGTMWEEFKEYWNVKSKTSKKVKMIPITETIASPWASHNLLSRMEEHGGDFERILVAIDRIEEIGFLNGETIGYTMFLKDTNFPNILNGAWKGCKKEK